MNPRSLAGWMIACALAVGLVWLRTRTPGRRADPAGGPRPGDPVVRIDVNDVARIAIGHGGRKTVLDRAAGHWTVSSMHAYPADFPRIARALTRLADVKVGQVFRAEESLLAEFGLAPYDEETLLAPPADAREPRVVELSDANDRTLARLTLGRERRPAAHDPGRGGFPDGAYLRVDEGPVLLVGDLFTEFSVDPMDWVDARLTSVSPDSVLQVETEVGGLVTRLVAGEDGFRLEDLGESEEEVEPNVRRMAGALQYLRAVGIADPLLPDDQTGLDSPGRYVLRQRDGRRVEALVGSRTPDESGRYLRLSVAFEPPPETDRPESGEPGGEGEEPPDGEAERRAREMNERLSPWLFIVPRHQADALQLTRQDLVQERSPEDEEEAGRPAENGADPGSG